GRTPRKSGRCPQMGAVARDLKLGDGPSGRRRAVLGLWRNPESEVHLVDDRDPGTCRAGLCAAARRVLANDDPENDRVDLLAPRGEDVDGPSERIAARSRTVEPEVESDGGIRTG